MTADDPTRGSDEWAVWRERVDLDEYDKRWRDMEAAGENTHGEADLVMSFAPRSVLDAGCGTGRVSIELARRGVVVVGVDLDPDLLDRAKRYAPELEWHLDDLSTFDLGRTFDVVVAPGNVIGFVAEADRPAAVRGCAAHVAPGGHLITAYSLNGRWPSVELLDRWCAEAGLELEARFATWDREPFGDPAMAEYHVSVHRRPEA